MADEAEPDSRGCRRGLEIYWCEEKGGAAGSEKDGHIRIGQTLKGELATSACTA